MLQGEARPVRRNLFTVVLFLAALLFAQNARAAQPSNYTKAVRDAMTPEQAEIVNNLDALSPDNDALVWNEDKTLLKVVTWKSRESYEHNLLPYSETSSNEAYVVWITLAPKVHEFCRDYFRSHPHATPKMLETRLKQRLGLHPDWQYDVFVELWVAPEDVFRPCVDPSPVDTSCDLNFGSEVPVVKNIQNYKAFYENIYYKSFRASPGAPWTGLGYTYDWRHPLKEQGLSEFILSPKASYTIEQAVPTWEYCQP